MIRNRLNVTVRLEEKDAPEIASFPFGMKHTKEVGGLMQEHGRQAAIAADSITYLDGT